MEAFKAKGGRSRGGSGGGILSNTGLGFGFGTIMSCPADDTSFYCRFSRIFNIITMVIALLVIGFLIYGLVTSKASLFGGASNTLMNSIKKMRF